MMHAVTYKPASTRLAIVIAAFFVFVTLTGTRHVQAGQDPTPCTSDLGNLGILCAADKLNKTLSSYTTYQNAKDSIVMIAVGKPAAGGSAMFAQEFNKWSIFSSLFESQGKQRYVAANFDQGFFNPVMVGEAPFPWDAAEPVSLVTLSMPLQVAIDRMRAESGCVDKESGSPFPIQEVSLWKAKHDPAGETKYYFTVVLKQPGKTKIIGVGTNAPYKVYDKCPQTHVIQ